MPKFRIGCHVPFTSAPLHAKSEGCDMMQIFLGDPQQLTSVIRTNEELVTLSRQLTKYKLKMVVHGSYAINLSNPIPSRKHTLSIKSIINDLKMISIIGKKCLGLIIHMGKNHPDNNLSSSQAIKNYVTGLKIALKNSPSDTTLILETGASQGNEVGSKLESLSLIYWSLTNKERDRIKFCIDTCHIWATGYNISNPTNVKKYFDLFHKLIGIDKIVCIHFNDSKTKLNSHLDRHADIGYGYIPISGLKAVIRFAYKYKIPIILETPLDAVDPITNLNVTFSDELAKIKSYVAKMA